MKLYANLEPNGGILEYRDTEKTPEENRQINLWYAFHRFKSFLSFEENKEVKRCLNSIEKQLFNR